MASNGPDLLGRLVEGAARGATEALTESAANRAYEDRNLLAVAFAVERAQLGCDAGYYLADDDGTNYLIVWAVLPTGQASWHVPPQRRELLEQSPLEETSPPGGYDGHSRPLKNRRVALHALGAEERIDEEGAA